MVGLPRLERRDAGAGRRGLVPEPFLHGAEGKRFPVRIDCAQDAEDECRRSPTGSKGAGSSRAPRRSASRSGKELLRVVGTWDDVRRDGATRRSRRVPRRAACSRACRRHAAGARSTCSTRRAAWSAGSARAAGSWRPRASRTSSRRGSSRARTRRPRAAVRLLDARVAARPLSRSRAAAAARCRSRRGARSR